MMRVVARLFIFTVGLLLILLCLVTAPLVPLFDPDEGYYPAAAAESLDAGTAWDLRLNGAPRWEKPVLSYALIQGAFALGGRRVTMARVPSALEGAALVVIVGLLVTRLAGRRAGALGAGIVATTLAVQIFARVAHPEIALVLGVIAAHLLICLWLVRHADGEARGTRGLACAIGIAIGYGILAKGPVAIALPALMIVVAAPLVMPMAALRRDHLVVARDAAIVVVTALAIAAPWYVAMTIRHGQEFLRDAIWRQNVVRYAAGVTGHRASPLFFVLPTCVGLLPWTALLPAAARRVALRPRAPREILRTCMAVAAATSFAFYSAAASKLANYALVIVPPLAILIALYLDERLREAPAAATRESRSMTRDWPARWTSALLIVTGLALLAVPALLRQGAITPRALLGGVPDADQQQALVTAIWWVAGPAGAVLILGGAAIGWSASAPTRTREGRGVGVGVGVLMAVGALVPLLILSAVGPLMRSIYPWESFGREIQRAEGPVWMYGYRAPSLAFYAGRPIERLPDLETLASELTHTAAGAWLIVDEHTRSSPDFTTHLGATCAHVVEVRGRMTLVRLRRYGAPMRTKDTPAPPGTAIGDSANRVLP